MGVVFTGTIDSQYFCGESLVDFLLPYGSPRTCSRQKEKAEFLRISNGSVFSIAIKIFPVSQKFFISDRSILCIDSRSNKYPRSSKSGNGNGRFILGFVPLVFYIMFLFLCSWLICKTVSENFIL